MTTQETADTIGDLLDYLRDNEQHLRRMEASRVRLGLGPCHLTKEADDMARYVAALQVAFKLQPKFGCVHWEASEAR